MGFLGIKKRGNEIVKENKERVGHSALRERGGKFDFWCLDLARKRETRKTLKRERGRGTEEESGRATISLRNQKAFCFSPGVAFSCTCSLISIAKEVQKNIVIMIWLSH